MNLEQVTTKIRPRLGWEAIDLGITLVQTHFVHLYTIWFLVSFPLLVGLFVTFWDKLWIALLVFWWLVPLLERPILYFLSRELFGEQLSVKQSTKMFFRLGKIQWFASLTYRRFSFTRNFDLPLILLEELKGSARSRRIQTIHRGDSGKAVWTSLLYFFIAFVFYCSIGTLVFLFIPDYFTDTFTWADILFFQSGNYWMTLFMSLVTYVCYSFLVPFGIASGFTLYLNQRTHIEAWDIELAFKRLASRLKKMSKTAGIRLTSILPMVFLISIMLTLQVDNANAKAATEIQEKIAKQDEEKTEKILVETNESATKERLTHSQAKELAKQIKAGGDFNRTEKITKYRYRSSVENKQESQETKANYAWLLILAKFFAVFVEFFLWLFIVVLVGFLLIRYRHLLIKPGKNISKKRHKPKTLFGLDLNVDEMPDEPWKVAQKLAQEQRTREAISLLYRASLIQIIDNTSIELEKGDTESQCLGKVNGLVSQPAQNYFYQLTSCWRNLAYAHQVPSLEETNTLCARWPKSMSNSAFQKRVLGNEATEKQNLHGGLSPS